MGPLAVKLEKNSSDEALIKTLITLAATSIARQDNPRRLEMMLNSELPPSQRIRYFD
jgi:chemotaxis protein MotA